jgi:nucleotide-binding universal stress UspA family protein
MPSDSQRHPIVLGIDALHPTHSTIAGASDAADRAGRRGRGGPTGMRLGSVPYGLLNRAHCPVAAVPSSVQDRP